MISRNTKRLLRTFAFGTDYIEEFSNPNDYNKVMNRIIYLQSINELSLTKVNIKDNEILLIENSAPYTFGHRGISGTYKIEAQFLFNNHQIIRIHYYVDMLTKIQLFLSGLIIIFFMLLTIMFQFNLLKQNITNLLFNDWIIPIVIILMKIINISFLTTDIKRFRNKIYILFELL